MSECVVCVTAIQLGCLFECGEERTNERIHLKVFALKELRPRGSQSKHLRDEPF